MTDFRHLLYWSGPGIILRGGRRVSDATFDAPGVRAVVIKWAELLSVEPADPWPTLRLEARTFRALLHEAVAPRAVGELEGFAAHVERFVDTVAARVPAALRDGWLARPDLEWESSRRMPGDVVYEPGQGAYRTGQPIDPRVMARRAANRLWPGGGRLPFELVGGEVALTEEHAYVRYSRRRTFRIELGQLAWRHQDAEHALVRYVFGRRAALLLEQGLRWCPVLSHLDDLFRARRRRELPRRSAQLKRVAWG